MLLRFLRISLVKSWPNLKISEKNAAFYAKKGFDHVLTSRRTSPNFILTMPLRYTNIFPMRPEGRSCKMRPPPSF